MIAPLPDDPKMLAYVKQVAAEMGVDDLTAWQMIQGGEGGASLSPEASGIVPDDATPLPAATAPGRRNRAAEVTQSPTRMVQPFSRMPQSAPAAQQPTLFSMLGMTKEEFQDQYNPKGPNTLAGWATDKLGLTDPNARQSERPGSLLSLAMQKAGVTGHEKKIAERSEAIEKENPYTINPKELKSRPQVTLASLLFPKDAAVPVVPPKKKPQTALGSLLSMFG